MFKIPVTRKLSEDCLMAYYGLIYLELYGRNNRLYFILTLFFFLFIDSLAMSACSRTVQESAVSGQSLAEFGSVHRPVWVCCNTSRQLDTEDSVQFCRLVSAFCSYWIQSTDIIGHCKCHHSSNFLNLENELNMKYFQKLWHYPLN